MTWVLVLLLVGIALLVMVAGGLVADWYDRRDARRRNRARPWR